MSTNFLKRKYSRSQLASVSMCAVFFATPLANTRVAVGSTSVSVFSLFIISFILWALVVIDSQSLKNHYKTHREFFLLVLGIFTIFAFKALHTPTGHAWGIVIEWIALPICLVVVVLAVVEKYSLQRSSTITNIFYSMLTGVVVSSTPFLLLGIQTYDGRFFGLWPSPNHLALFLAPVLVFCAVSIVLHPTRKNYLLATPLVIFGGIIGLLTQSFGAILGVAVGFLSGMIWSLCKKGKKRYIFGIMMICSVFVALAGWQKYNSAYADIDRSPLASRVMIWTSALDILRGESLLGIGLGTFQDTYLDRQKHYEPYLEWAVPHPHNTFLAMWLYGGLLGLVLLCLVCAKVLFSFFSQKNTPIYTVALLGAFIALMAQSIFDTAFFRQDLAIIFWFLCVGLIFFSPHTRSDESYTN